MAERWRHHMVVDRAVNNLNDLHHEINLLAECRQWKLTVWEQRGQENQLAMEVGTRFEEVTAECNAATVARDCALAAEADVRIHAIA